MQIQENRTLLEKGSVIFSQRAYGLIGQATQGALRNCGIEGILSEVGERGRGPRGAFVDNKDVSVLGYYAWVRCTERVLQGALVLTVKIVADLEEFLRVSQQELHSSLSTAKTEYVTAIRKLAEAAKDKRFKALGVAIRQLDPHLQPQLPRESLGTWTFGPYEVKGLY